MPTPQARDHHGAQLPELRREGGHQVNLNDAALGLAVSWERDRWGRYEPAIRRWEATTGRAAPFPAERGRTGNLRLSPLFAEWMFGITGWVTGVAGLPYYAQVRALGNGVVPAQAAAALRLLIRVATMPGTRLSADLTCPHEKRPMLPVPGGRPAGPARHRHRL